MSDENIQMNPEDMDRSTEETQPVASASEPEIVSHEQVQRPQVAHGESAAWFTREEIADLRGRWSSLQAQFVEQPRSALEQAEALVAETGEKISRMLADQQTSLSEQWCNHEDASTEDLRLIMLNYRTLLNRFLEE